MGVPLASPALGVAAATGEGLVFTAPAGVVATTSFTYRATDSGGESTVGTASVRIYGTLDLAAATSASTKNEDGTANRNRSEGCGHFLASPRGR